MMSMETVLALHAVDGVSLTYCIILGKLLYYIRANLRAEWGAGTGATYR